MSQTEGFCPVCGQKYYERNEHTIRDVHKLGSFGSNCLFGECVRITRVAQDSEPWEAEIFSHTAEQSWNTGSNNEL